VLVTKNGEGLKEIAVLDPRVFQNPELETKLFPPLKKVIYGNYSYKDSKDTKILIGMEENKLQKYHYIEKYKNKRFINYSLKLKMDKSFI
jgi:hypothetical protein